MSSVNYYDYISFQGRGSVVGDRIAVRLDGGGAVGAGRRPGGSEHNNREEEDAANRGPNCIWAE
jgi:hypothetical protein